MRPGKQGVKLPFLPGFAFDGFLGLDSVPHQEQDVKMNFLHREFERVVVLKTRSP